MSDWRNRVDSSVWRYVKKANDVSGDCTYHLEAKVWTDGWEEFGVIDMDCAAEGTGENIAVLIVNNHNKDAHRIELDRLRHKVERIINHDHP